MATNYPLVRITNSNTGDVCFGRSYDFSTMGALQVIVNGLASAGISVKLKG